MNSAHEETTRRIRSLRSQAARERAVAVALRRNADGSDACADECDRLADEHAYLLRNMPRRPTTLWGTLRALSGVSADPVRSEWVEHWAREADERARQGELLWGVRYRTGQVSVYSTERDAREEASEANAGQTRPLAWVIRLKVLRPDDPTLEQG